MTDNDIIKALEHCHKISFKNYPCENCPLINEECFGGKVLMKRAVDLIKRQQAEIEGLKKELGIGHICGDVVVHTKTLDDYYKFKKSIKAEAVKEFAERLKESKGKISMMLFTRESTTDFIPIENIDNLVKEMVGEG